jgi:myo-inositol-1(or 4)-monophosphatase
MSGRALCLLVGNPRCNYRGGVPPAPTSDLDSLLGFAVELALEASAFVHERARRDLSVATKSTITDLVTDVDRAVESLIVQRITLERPGEAIVGEEGPSAAAVLRRIDAGLTASESRICWHIDPVDGTTNFVYGYPAYAISIGVEVEGERVVGVVHNLASGETFTAASGRGAFLDGKPIHVSRKSELSTTLLGTGFAYDPEYRSRQGAVLARLLGRVRDVRRSGSAALDLCSVACGRLDAYYEQPLAPWDYSAGDVIVREAGGVTGSIGGGPIVRGSVLATSPELMEPLLALLREAGAPDAWPARPRA